jgi:FkbM family methyltransferase
VTRVGFPVLRGYVRWVPGPGKRPLVTRLIEPRLAARPHAFTARTIHGARLQGDQRWTMPRRIYWFGVWEPLLSAWIEGHLRSGDVFVDVGANMGYTSLLAAHAVDPEGSVVAFEPAPETFAKLEANLVLNPGVSVRAVQAAVGAHEGRVPFYRAPWNDAESSTVAGERLEPAGEVAVAPLARLLTRDERARTRVVKVDVEGAEWDVVAGLAPDVERFPPSTEIVIEVHPGKLGGRSAAALADLLAPYGFAPSWLPRDISAAAHLERRPEPTPARGLPPDGAMAHLILSRG